ncbi:putative minor capsid protein [Lactiplantibacillus plantarum]|uniref:putative minor capsid protein n=1 Tax=Lactiplantibacillus plantarum TaxID=1590 RepID=UPI000CDDDA90|nr:putative minor capsid protein [Lactiplantibacillus plantarum]
MDDIIDPIPIELLDDAIKVTPCDANKAKQDSWTTSSDSNGSDDYMIRHVRVEPTTSVSVQSVGNNTSTQVVTGAYTLIIDSANSAPLNKLPSLNDKIQVQSTQQSLVVKSLDPIYDFGTHVHHWEGVLQ